MQEVTQWYGCQVCGEALNHWKENGLGGFQHPPRLGMGTTRDHGPVPVPLESIENLFHMCDFCGSEDVVCQFTGGRQTGVRYDHVHGTGAVHDKVLTRSFRTAGITHKVAVSQPLGVVVGGIDATTSELWTACEPCAKVVEKGNMGRVITHVKAVYQADPARRHRTPTRAALETLYEPLFENLQTARIPL